MNSSNLLSATLTTRRSGGPGAGVQRRSSSSSSSSLSTTTMLVAVAFCVALSSPYSIHVVVEAFQPHTTAPTRPLQSSTSLRTNNNSLLLRSGAASPRASPTSMVSPPRGLSTSRRYVTSSSARGLSAQDEVILREFEKKEAVLRKRREEALSKLNEYESTLNSLKSKKAEYLAAAQLAKPPLGGTFSETTIRSVVKSFLWRVVAGSVTFVTSYQFSGSLQTAFQLVGADFFSKAFTMFAGERLMNKSKAGRATGSDNVGRSFAKALLWRLFAICNTLGFALFISKDLSVAGKIASTDAVFKTGLMFAYERVWARIQWGKEYLLEYSI